MPDYLGSCRCGATTTRLRSGLPPEHIHPRSDAITCNFCRQHDGVWISDPQGVLMIDRGNKTTVSQFASEQVRFHFCAECREMIYAIFADPNGVEVAVVRIGLFKDIVSIARSVTKTTFEAESIDSANARRLRNWTPVVWFPT
jgi:hypothetical protein